MIAQILGYILVAIFGFIGIAGGIHSWRTNDFGGVWAGVVCIIIAFAFASCTGI